MIGIQFEVDSPSLMHCLPFDKKSMIHGVSDLLTPYLDKFIDEDIVINAVKSLREV